MPDLPRHQHTPSFTSDPNVDRDATTATYPDSPRPFVAPTVPGYEIVGELGRGGMGVVYKARNVALNRPAAIKMILGGKYTDPLAQARFLVEAEVIARLSHPHVVQVFEFGRCDGQPYFVLEYVAGGTLAGRLKAGGRFAPREAAGMVAKLAAAMAVAHSQGVVHRDLKPANVLLSESGEPKIADFGLAKVGDSGATASGAVMGTPSYMAPEQAAGDTREAGTPADVYALGVILYELLTGRPPFQGDTAMNTIMLVLAAQPEPPRALVPSVPHDLETICLKCLEKKPQNRYPSAAELRDELGRYLRGESILARPTGRVERAVKWVRRNPVIAGATLAVFVALSVGTTLSYLGYRDAFHQTGVARARETEARIEADKAKKARDFLVRIFELSDGNGQRGTMTARQILDDAEKRIPTDFADQPELRDELLAAVEGVYAKITADAPLAMILETRGAVTLRSTRNPAGAVPNVLVYAGDQFVLAPDAHVRLVVLSDLHHEDLRPGVLATVRRKGCVPLDAVLRRGESDLLTFVPLPKATFYMGAAFRKAGVKTEIGSDFEIAAHAVTQGQWQRVMGDNPSAFSRFAGHRNRVRMVTDEELKLFPVDSVTWDEVQVFLKKLNERQRGSGWLYRLPTQAEWEYACRNGSTAEGDCSFPFYFAEPSIQLTLADGNYGGTDLPDELRQGKGLNRTSRVGAYPPNKLGLCDMHGNVKQWCSDTDGRIRFCRGGAWSYAGTYCQADTVLMLAADERNNYNGFRLVRVRAPESYFRNR